MYVTTSSRERTTSPVALAISSWPCANSNPFSANSVHYVRACASHMQSNTELFIEKNLGLVCQLYDDREPLSCSRLGPTAFATNHQKITISVLFYVSFEGCNSRLQRRSLPSAGSRMQTAAEPPRQLWMRPLFLSSPPEVIKDELRGHPSQKPKVHSHSGIVRACMAHRRIVSQGDSDGSSSRLALKERGNRNLVDREVVDGELIFGVENHSRIVRIRRAFERDETGSANCSYRVLSKCRKTLLRGLWHRRSADHQRPQ
jgi:hypothetical protein